MRGPATILLLTLLAPPQASAVWLGARAQSRWNDAAIAVDGRREDWTLVPAEDARGVSYGFANDERYLYLLLVPHTRSAREQLAGVYQQDLVFWLDASAGKKRLQGLRVLAPAALSQPTRALEAIRLPDADDAAVAVSPTRYRGALEARLPLSWLGSKRPSAFTVGVEAQSPRRPPAPPPRRGPREGPDFGPPPFEPFTLWMRVTLASPPRL